MACISQHHLWGSIETLWGYDTGGPANLMEMSLLPYILWWNVALWLMQCFVGGYVRGNCPWPVIREPLSHVGDKEEYVACSYPFDHFSGKCKRAADTAWEGIGDKGSSSPQGRQPELQESCLGSRGWREWVPVAAKRCPRRSRVCGLFHPSPTFPRK